MEKEEGLQQGDVKTDQTMPPLTANNVTRLCIYYIQCLAVVSRERKWLNDLGAQYGKTGDFPKLFNLLGVQYNVPNAGCSIVL